MNLKEICHVIYGGSMSALGWRNENYVKLQSV